MKKYSVSGVRLESESLRKTLGGSGANGRFMDFVHFGDGWQDSALKGKVGVYLVGDKDRGYYVGQGILTVRCSKHFNATAVPKHKELCEWEREHKNSMWFLPLHVEDLETDDEDSTVQADRINAIEDFIIKWHFGLWFNKQRPKFRCTYRTRQEMGKLRKAWFADPLNKSRFRLRIKNRPPPWNKGKTGIYSADTLARMGKKKPGYKPWNKGLHTRTDKTCKRCGVDLSPDELERHKNARPEHRLCSLCKCKKAIKRRGKLSERRSAGMCRRCDTPRLEGKDLCEKHFLEDIAQREKEKRELAEKKKALIAKGLCVGCEKPYKSSEGFINCPKCRKEVARICRRYGNDNTKKRRRRLIAENRCVKCTRKLTPSEKTHCEVCRIAVNAEKKKWADANRAKVNQAHKERRARRKENRECRECGKALQPHNGILCDFHEEKKKAYRKK